jgi:basic amino acid/polyamine antiporter, APA family
MVVMRQKAPNHPRPFSTPAPWVIAVAAIIGCGYLFASLPLVTIKTFIIWNVIGLIVYFIYARHQSLLSRAAA